jgi:hypothetical protein
MDEVRPGGRASPEGHGLPEGGPGPGPVPADATAVADRSGPDAEGGGAEGERPASPSPVARVTGSLPALFMKYERLCERVATRGVHNLAFFLSTAFFAPVGLYVWESREGRGWIGRLVRGAAAWALLIAAALIFLNGGWIAGVAMLALGRPLRWLLRVTRLSRARPSPDIPRKLTFEIRTLDISALVMISVIFLVMVANRDTLKRLDPVTDSDPMYHMAVARQIIDQGRLPRWDYWEYAPFGRPHLYHPALHYLIVLFSWKSGDVVYGFNTLQMLLYPLALLGGWYFARWLFGAAGGFLSLIFLSMGMFFLVSQAMAMPAALVTALIPPILMAFLAKRTLPAVLLLTFALYTHGPVGVPQLVVLGLLVFSMRHREWFPFFRKVIAFAGLLYLPWVVRMFELDGLAWFGSSVGAMGPAKDGAELVKRGLLQLQIINPILLFLAFRTWWRDGDGRLGVVKSLLLGFLPMLFAYGGRFFMHTWPLWSILMARNFEAWLARPESAAEEGDPAARKSLRRRTLAFVGLAFLPLPVVMVGMNPHRGLHPAPGITALNASVFLALGKVEPEPEFERMAACIRRLLPPEPMPTAPPRPDPTGHEPLRREGLDEKPKSMHDLDKTPEEYEAWLAEPVNGVGGERTYDKYLKDADYLELRERIVHIGEKGVPGNPFVLKYGSLYLGNRLTVATGCRTDTGGWGPEVRSVLMAREVARAREAPTPGLFVFFDKAKVIPDSEAARLRKAHSLDWMRRFGPHYLLGGRGVAEEPEEEF